MVGRPTKLTEETVDNITTALMIGATQELAAQYAGITGRTFYLWKARGQEVYDRLQEEQKREDESLIAIAAVRRENKGKPKKEQKPLPDRYKGDFTVYKDEEIFLHFFQAVQEANATGAINHLNYLNQLAPTSERASMWLLENRYPEHYRPVQRHEHSGPGGGAIETKDTSDLTMEERALRLLHILESAKQRSATAEGEQADNATDDGGGVT